MTDPNLTQAIYLGVLDGLKDAPMDPKLSVHLENITTMLERIARALEETDGGGA